MMNQGGWGFKNVFAIIIVLTIAILIAMVLYNRDFGELFGMIDVDDEITYQNLEDRLVRAAITYTDNYYNRVLQNGDNDYVTVSTLIKKGVMKEIEDIEDENTICTGYVHFYRSDGKTTYDPYLKCGTNYFTSGYNSTYDE